ncbi:MAG TPA: hypothetical protein VG097_06175 [Gemmata sp.]|jgi:phage terminase Nu1 subunit (DNA packaging protein)|nr:hypothetical protein [Gemmata sp.]
MTTTDDKSTEPNPINIDNYEAERLTGLSSKTLERLAKSGEPVGRFKAVARVLFHLESLRTWFANRANGNKSTGPNI